VRGSMRRECFSPLTTSETSIESLPAGVGESPLTGVPAQASANVTVLVVTRNSRRPSVSLD
jgi:hypothetical protein